MQQRSLRTHPRFPLFRKKPSRFSYRERTQFDSLDVHQLEMSSMDVPSPRWLKKSTVVDSPPCRSYSLTIAGLFPRKSSSRLVLYSTRIVFVIVVLLSLIVLLISSAFFALDMFVSSSCQLVHADQPAVISLLTGIESTEEERRE